MKVSELIEELQAHDPDDLIVMSKDGEGNMYSPLEFIDSMFYVPESEWAGMVYIRTLTDQEIEDGYTEDDLAPDGSTGYNALVLWPVG